MEDRFVRKRWSCVEMVALCGIVYLHTYHYRVLSCKSLSRRFERKYSLTKLTQQNNRFRRSRINIFWIKTPLQAENFGRNFIVLMDEWCCDVAPRRATSETKNLFEYSNSSAFDAKTSWTFMTNSYPYSIKLSLISFPQGKKELS